MSPVSPVSHVSRVLAGPFNVRLIGLPERMAWRYPEWWSIALSLTTWLLLAGASGTMGEGVSRIPLHNVHNIHDAQSDVLSLAVSLRTIVPQTLDWMLMVAAMMFPLVLGPIRATALRSVWRRRHRAIVGFLLGYSGPWLMVGISISVLFSGLSVQHRFGPSASAALGFAVAALWQGTAVRLRALRSCHRTTPLAPSGWRADRDCLRYGWSIGLHCIVSCWALMLACLLSGHSLVVMLFASAIGITERYKRRPDQRWFGGLLAGISVVYAVIALNSPW